MKEDFCAAFFRSSFASFRCRRGSVSGYSTPWHLHFAPLRAAATVAAPSIHLLAFSTVPSVVPFSKANAVAEITFLLLVYNSKREHKRKSVRRRRQRRQRRRKRLQSRKEIFCLHFFAPLLFNFARVGQRHGERETVFLFD